MSAPPLCSSPLLLPYVPLLCSSSAPPLCSSSLLLPSTPPLCSSRLLLPSAPPACSSAYPSYRHSNFNRDENERVGHQINRGFRDKNNSPGTSGLTGKISSAAEVSRGRQPQSPWIIPTAAVSEHVCRQAVSERVWPMPIFKVRHQPSPPDLPGFRVVPSRCIVSLPTFRCQLLLPPFAASHLAASSLANACNCRQMPAACQCVQLRSIAIDL